MCLCVWKSVSNGPEWSARSSWELRPQEGNWGGRARGEGQGQREEGRLGGSWEARAVLLVPPTQCNSAEDRM